MTHDFETVDIAKLAVEIVTEMDIQINEAGAAVTIEKNIPEVWGDRVRIRQILENLLSNALKYARQDDKQCAIRIGGVTEGGYVRLTIADNGPGVPREYEQKIFELFQRLKTDADGTGIGLAIVKRVAELHMGNAWVEPTPGGGATFCVTFARREDVSGRLAA